MPDVKIGGGSARGPVPSHPLGTVGRMESWSRPAVPRLPGKGRPLRLHDTATGEFQPTRARPHGEDLRLRHHALRRDPTSATPPPTSPSTSCSGCGSTAGHDVRYVQNVTDVDDPLLERAERDGQDWTELAQRETAL